MRPSFSTGSPCEALEGAQTVLTMLFFWLLHAYCISFLCGGIVTQEQQTSTSVTTTSDATESAVLPSSSSTSKNSAAYSLQSRERLLRNRSDHFRLQHRLISELVRHTHDKLSDSKPKQIALNMASEVLRSLESVYLKSAMNVEREWLCWSKNYTIDRVQEYKFQAFESYDASGEILDTAEGILEKIETKTRSFWTNAPA